jgi:hypothetical protein
MKTEITAANFATFKVQILNACSVFGAIKHPENWATCLSIFNFDEVAEDMATSLLIDTYYEQIKFN